MKRFFTTSLFVLLSAVILAPAALANDNTAPAETSNQPAQDRPEAQADQTSKGNEKQLVNRPDDKATNAPMQLSERDRLIQQYQLQQIIPAQE